MHAGPRGAHARVWPRETRPETSQPSAGPGHTGPLLPHPEGHEKCPREVRPSAHEGVTVSPRQTTRLETKPSMVLLLGRDLGPMTLEVPEPPSSWEFLGQPCPVYETVPGFWRSPRGPLAIYIPLRGPQGGGSHPQSEPTRFRVGCVVAGCGPPRSIAWGVGSLLGGN